VKADPANSEAVYNLGNALAGLGKHEEAVEAFTSALELGGNRSIYFFNRGISFERLGRHEKALDDYNAALQLEPRNADIMNSRGVLLWAQGKTDNALQDFSGAAQLDAKHLAAHKNLARAYLSLGKPDDAMAVLEKARVLAPKDSDIAAGLGDALFAKKKFAQAIHFYRQALNRETDASNRSRVLIRMGLAYEAEGNTTAALKTYAKALESAAHPDLKREISQKIEELKARSRR
jgi:tetratricopeptide (TPR) repeat protein